MLTRSRLFPCTLLASALIGGVAPLAAHAQEADDGASIASFRAAAPAATCAPEITPSQHLVITDLSVVNDPVRTRWTGATRTTTIDSNGVRRTSADGAWHFGQLMASMAGTRHPPNFVKSWLQQWSQPRVVNGLTVPARANIQSIIDAWPKLANGDLNLAKAPMRLLAIVNRFDLQGNGRDAAGEGRFVFGVLGPDGSPLQFTVILEYKMPTGSQGQTPVEWATQWRNLTQDGTVAFGDTYRARLQRLTDRFTVPAYPARQNNSAIGQVRTNEIALAAPWELREFRLTSEGWLRMSTTARTPAAVFDGTDTLAQFLTDFHNSGAPLPVAVPLTLNAAPFRGAGAVNNIDFWSAPGFTDSTIRHNFSLNTCNGCHGRETNTFFLHVRPRLANEASSLSAFLSGSIKVSDPVTREVRQFDEMQNRSNIFRSALCNP